jgi:beta-1,4-mannosyltransferase
MDVGFKVLVYPGWKGTNYYNQLYGEDPHIEYAQYSGGMFALLKNINLHHPTVIHLHWLTAYFAIDVPWSPNFLIRYIIAIFDLLFVKWFTDVKLVWTVHNLYEHETKHQKLELLAKRLVAKLVDKIIVLGPSAEPLVIKHYKADKNKIEVSLHGHFNHIFPQTITSKTDCRTALNLSEDKLIYLFPGAAKEYKGIVELVEAFKKWGNEKVVLVIAGKISSHTLTKIGSLPINVIIRNKFIANEDMPKYFVAADWTVIPYNRILTSATLLTAMGLGSAVIVPQMGTLGDYLDEQGGILYPKNEKDCLLSALQKSTTLNHRQLGAYNQNKALRFDWTNITKQTLEILRTA